MLKTHTGNSRGGGHCRSPWGFLWSDLSAGRQGRPRQPPRVSPADRAWVGYRIYMAPYARRCQHADGRPRAVVRGETRHSDNPGSTAAIRVEVQVVPCLRVLWAFGRGRGVECGLGALLAPCERPTTFPNGIQGLAEKRGSLLNPGWLPLREINV